MTAKDYKLIASVLRDAAKMADVDWIVAMFSERLRQANVRFDSTRFVQAVYRGDPAERPSKTDGKLAAQFARQGSENPYKHRSTPNGCRVTCRACEWECKSAPREASSQMV